MGYIDIVLTPQEIKRCVDWTKEKQQYKQERAVVDQWYDQNSNSQAVDLMGRLGEIAAARALELDWSEDLDWNITAGGDTGIDFSAYGYKWDAKTSTLDALIFNSDQHFKADVAILVQLIGDREHPEYEGSIYRVWGVCSKKKFLKDRVAKNYAGRDRVAVTTRSITSVSDFFDYLRRRVWQDVED
jgi:hypothetical protein